MSLLTDVRFGVRVFRKAPGFSVVAVLTLALGIGVNAAIFSVIHALYLEPLPYRDAERLVMIWSYKGADRNGVSPADYLDWKRQATVFEDLNAWSGRDVNLSTPDRPEQVRTGPSTPGFLAMLGYGHPLAHGRSFTEEEGVHGQDKVVVLSHRIWQQRLGGDPGLVGRTVRIDGEPHTVVGILGQGPADENMNQMWTSLAFAPAQLDRASGWRYLNVMGRLKAGVSLEQANAELETISANLAAAHPAANTGWVARVEPFRNNFVARETKSALWLLTGAVAFVLLIACANIANLLLARGQVRQREVAVRSALGASRGAILRQFLTESLILALAGGVLGVALAYGLVEAIVTLLPPFTLPTETIVRLNLPVLMFALAACSLSGLLFGCAPAWQALRTNLNDTLKEAGRTLGGGHALRSTLVVVEFALALSLLTGGGLAVYSFVKLTRVDLGVRPERVLTFTLPVRQAQPLPSPERLAAFNREVLERIQAVPGVEAASLSMNIPLRGGLPSYPFTIVGRPAEGDRSQLPRAWLNLVTPDYHRTLGVRIVRGRGFDEQDRAGGVPVALVNETFVRRHLPGVDPIGQRIVVEEASRGFVDIGAGVERQIVGVYADVRSAGPGEETWPAIDQPFWQNPWPWVRVAVRTAGEPERAQRDLAAAVRSVDPDLPLGGPRTLEQVAAERMAEARFNTALFGAFGALALVLAAVGIYGVMSFTVAQRTREIGLRIALGASRGRVVGGVLRDGLTTALAGTVLGSGGAYLVSRAMASVLRGVDGVDPMVLGGVAAILLAAAFAACLAPARRAARVDPMVALRQE